MVTRSQRHKQEFYGTPISSVFSSNFNVADTNLENVSGWSRLDGPVGGAAVRSNMVASLAGSSAYIVTDQGSANHWVSAEVRSFVTNPGCFIACRVTDSNNWVGMITNSNSGGCEVWKRVGGTYTALLPATSPPIVGDTIRLECNGTTWRALKNGTQIGTGAINAPTLTSTRQGLIATSGQNPAYDNFQAGVL